MSEKYFSPDQNQKKTWLQKLRAQYSYKVAKSPIRVQLIACTENPYNIATASARTCYSSNGILLPSEMQKNEKAKEISDRVAKSTLKSGHLTTRQHAHFVFGIAGVTRALIWQGLHSHPYYNSEQVSQRYVAIKNEPIWYSLPENLKLPEVTKFHERSHNVYTKLNEILFPIVRNKYYEIHRLKARFPEKYNDAIKKRCIEVSRYVMPLSTTAYLYHTISSLTLHRYARMMYATGMEEFIILCLKMFDEIEKIDIDLINEIPEPLEIQTPVTDPVKAEKSNFIFDNLLGVTGARLVSCTPDADGVLHDVLATLLGREISQEDAIRMVLSPAENNYLGDVFYPGTLDHVTRSLQHIHLTFQKKLSHTADSQEQRHRTLAGSRPLLTAQMSLKEDYITPLLINESAEAVDVYCNHMQENFALIKSLYSRGVTLSDLSLLLPNAFPIRFYESGEFLNFYHKWKARLCYNAQEEIFHATLAEVRAASEKLPEIMRHVGPPCAIRSHLKPRCPEGEHFCGIKVWEQSPGKYKRIL